MNDYSYGISVMRQYIVIVVYNLSEKEILLRIVSTLQKKKERIHPRQIFGMPMFDISYRKWKFFDKKCLNALKFKILTFFSFTIVIHNILEDVFRKLW